MHCFSFVRCYHTVSLYMSFTYVSLTIERRAGRPDHHLIWFGKSLSISLILVYVHLCQLLEHHLKRPGLISFHTIRDKFTALLFTSTYCKTLVGLKRISEAGTQQLLLNVYDETIPVLEVEKTTGTFSRHHAADSLSGGSTTKMVNKEFRKLEVR